MKYFVSRNKETNNINVATINDPDFDAFKEISQDGFYIQDSDVPEYAKEFFNAVDYDENKKLFVDINKARELTKERIRREREHILSNLDIIYQRALESGRDLKIVEDEKQRMRDLPEYVNDIDDLQELLDFKVISTLKFSELPPAKNSSDNPEILIIQKQNEELKKQNEDLALNLKDLINQMNTLQTKLKKKYII